MSARRPVGRLLSAAEAGLYGDAAAALATARMEAEALLARAADAAQAAHDAVLRDAADAARLQTSRTLAETAAASRRAMDALAPSVATVIGQAMARLLGDLDVATAVAAAARHAVGELAARQAVLVHVHPACTGATRTALLGWGDGVRVTGDDALPEDACTIETPAGIVRAGLREQLAVLQAALHAA